MHAYKQYKYHGDYLNLLNALDKLKGLNCILFKSLFFIMNTSENAYVLDKRKYIKHPFSITHILKGLKIPPKDKELFIYGVI